jgi:hypothetical protein
VANAGKKMCGISLDLHASAAAETLLTTPKFTIHKLGMDDETGGKA